MPFKVLVPDAHFRDLDVERGVSGDTIDYLVHDETNSSAIPDDVWNACDAVLVWHRMRIDAAVVAKLANCRLIVRVGVGFDNVDTAACHQRGIPVANVPNYGTTEVADHAMAMMLHLTRGLSTYEARMRKDPVAGFVAEDAPVVRRLRKTTFGAVGMGRIGTAIARRAAAFDMKIVYYDPYLPEGHDLSLGYERVRSLEALLGQSDVVSLHVPLSANTREMMGAREFAAMKPDATFINIARGGLYDIDALYDALRSGHVAAAGLDVFPQEPPVSTPRLVEAWRNNEDWLAGRLVLSPHAAFYSEAAYRDMRTFSAEILMEYLVAGNLRNNVNPGWNSKVA
ncbi:MAG: dehydrogenase [Rhizobiales bacterium]|nr:dehydrogenase [Hyphomicrobiales bacterium]MBA68441.1 dehydrogenase [Hyphomicrobiales bacterium]|tara:strand:- start:303 stop:1322 length:1020 start_codon:yes stop_codon:yes gene_type:complete